ncbi:MAG: hypothetical protein ABIJ95_05215 [Pseudomonadota bacterium]
MRTFLILLVAVATACVAVYNFDDAIRDSAHNGRGAEKGLELMRLLHRTEVRLGPKAEDLTQYFLKSLARFDFPAFYESDHLSPLPAGGRGAVFMGVNQGDTYWLDVVPPESGLCPRKSLGSFVAELGLERRDDCPAGGRSFKGWMDICADSGELTHENILALGEGFMRVSDPANIKAMQKLRKRSNRFIPVESLQVIHEFYKCMPHLAVIMKDYTYMLHTELVREEHQGQAFTRCTLRIFPRVDVITRDYPRLGKYLDDLRGLFRFSSRFTNDQGHTIAEFVSESERDIITLKMLTRQGRYIPMDGQGMPVFEEEFSATELADYSFHITSNVSVSVYGLAFHTPDIQVDAVYRNRPDKASLDLALKDIGTTTVTGKLGGAVPKWVVDLAIPSNLDEYINSFTQTLVQADGGRGSRMRLSWNLEDPEHVGLDIKGVTEFADNFYVRFGLATFRYCFKTTGEIQDEFEMLASRTMTAVMADLMAIRDAAPALEGEEAPALAVEARPASASLTKNP